MYLFSVEIWVMSKELWKIPLYVVAMITQGGVEIVKSMQTCNGGCINDHRTYQIFRGLINEKSYHRTYWISHPWRSFEHPVSIILFMSYPSIPNHLREEIYLHNMDHSFRYRPTPIQKLLQIQSNKLWKNHYPNNTINGIIFFKQNRFWMKFKEQRSFIQITLI